MNLLTDIYWLIRKPFDDLHAIMVEWARDHGITKPLPEMTCPKCGKILPSTEICICYHGHCCGSSWPWKFTFIRRKGR